MMTKLGRGFIKAQECQQLLKQLIALGLATEKPRVFLKKEKEAQTTSQQASLKDSQIYLKITIDDLTNAIRKEDMLAPFLDTL
jgi:hypothetical protein